MLGLILIKEQIVKRKIIQIDEDKCDGCGLCIPECPEGAMQVIDGKARLISDLFCDGLGACVGHCPQSAITVVEREAEPYDESKVMENVVKQGVNTIRAHLEHLKDHGEKEFLDQAVKFLNDNNIEVPVMEIKTVHHGHSCPGSKNITFDTTPSNQNIEVESPSALNHWPVQMHLIGPHAPQYMGADVVLAADCVAYALGNFHQKYLKDKALAIACPKLDQNQRIYLEKMIALIDEAKINTLTVMIMQVPCCGGLLQMAKQAAEQAERNIPIKLIVVGVQGEILQDDWV